MMRLVPITLAAALLLSAAPVHGRELIAIDGDTFIVNRREHIRLLHVDAPEMRGKCQAEIDLAHKSKDMLEQLLASPRVVIHRDRTKHDKYGRTLATVTAGKQDVGTALVQAGLARPYDGGRRGPWC